MSEFLNPYTFVRATERSLTGEFGDATPPGHDRLVPDRLTGRLVVTMEVVTPLLILDDATAATDARTDHTTYEIRKDRDGRPLIPPSSVKGMLRAAYEAITTSRFGVFQGHDRRLAYRMAARDGLALVPARVSDDGKRLLLCTGTAPVKRSRRDPLHAAWLPAYGARGRESNLGGWEHGQPVAAWLRLVERPQRGRQPAIRLWQVVEIKGRDDQLSPVAPDLPNQTYTAVSNEAARRIDGWVCWTNQNISKKHDERIFFVTGSSGSNTVELSNEMRQFWRDVIGAYRDAHDDRQIHQRPRRGKKGTAKPSEYLGNEPGKTAWSRHIYSDDERELQPGSLCYARLTDGELTGVFPVSISRELFADPPRSLLDHSLQPATSESELSSADRVFGWVNQSGPGAWKGSLGLGPVRPSGGAGVEHLGDGGIPLAVLAAPKPQQARFYVGRPEGTPLPEKSAQSDAYQEARQRLRGRKFYLHHAHGLERADTWKRGGRSGEFRRRDGIRDSQNRTIREWISPGSRFEVEISVENLAEAELGALLWLFDLPEGACLRVGYGKPLGFGSVRLGVEVERSDVRTGSEWAASWRTLEQTSEAFTEQRQRSCIDAFRSSSLVEASSDQPEFDSLPHIRDFLVVACGRTDLPVHYPRVDLSGEDLRWWTGNERGEKRPLPEAGQALST